jgi:osmotically-inducible protein OsmY
MPETWDPRSSEERSREGQWNQSGNYDYRRQMNAGRHEWEDPGRQRFRNDEYGSQRYRENYRPPQTNQGAADYGEYRDRPYSNSGSYEGHGGFEGHIDPYREGRERGYGATSTGTGWGAAETGRHRLGSLTESAAASAQSVIGSRGYGERHYGDDYPERISHAGKGPKGYRRSDERIREEVCEILTRNRDLDASNIEVTVIEGVVTLSGNVEDRQAKRLAEDLAQDVSGARDVENHLRVGGDLSITRGTSEQPNESGATASGTSGSVLGLRADAAKQR